MSDKIKEFYFDRDDEIEQIGKRTMRKHSHTHFEIYFITPIRKLHIGALVNITPLYWVYMNITALQQRLVRTSTRYPFMSIEPLKTN